MRTIIFLILLSGVAPANAQLMIGQGAQFSVNGDVQITLHNTDLVNNGLFISGTSRVSFTGNVISNIGGTGALKFHLLEINKSGANVHLQKNISISASIRFLSGMLLLDGHDIDLETTGVLEGEKEASHIIGPNGGEVVLSTTLNNPLSINPGNLGAIISTTQNLGNVVIKRGHQSQSNAFGNGITVLRYYTIAPANNSSLNATLRFHYFDGELNGLTEGSLSLWRSENNLQWTNEAFTSFDTTANYVEKTGIFSFSRWTLTSSNNALPVTFVFFNTHCENGRVVITWKTAQEMKSNYFNIERSQDGRNWAVIGTMQAAGVSNTERTYRFTDNVPLPDGLYRIAQHDLDGNRQYSVVVHSSCDVKDNMNLWPNPAQSTAWLSITTNTGSPVIIKLYDSKGSLMYMRNATLSPGTNQLAVPVDRLPKGMYNVVADFMNGTIKTLRLVKN